MRSNKNAPTPEGGHDSVLTPSGVRKLEEELEHLKGTRRKEIAERIKQAKEFGDLSENAEYDDAKNEQGFVEERIRKIEQILRTVRVIDESATDSDTVAVGSTVRVREVAAGDERSLTIVGSAEANPLEDRISNESPVGRALLGRKKGETVTIRVPAGTIKYAILDIAH